jgi:hypothetical protein
MRLLTYYVPWLFACICLYTAQAYASNLNNVWSGKYTWLWPFMSARSSNIAFDGVLYDTTMLLTYAISINVFSNKGFTLINWIGLGVVLIGIFLLRR